MRMNREKRLGDEFGKVSLGRIRGISTAYTVTDGSGCQMNIFFVFLLNRFYKIHEEKQQKEKVM
jgi:hypothetical protein